MADPFLLVGLSNTFHLLATVLWIGWSALLPLVVAPRALQLYQGEGGALSWLVERAPPLAYGALLLLGATGMLQMGAHPHYEGLFALGNLWSQLLFVKHLLVLASVALLFYLSQQVGPRLRLAAQRARLGQPGDPAPLLARFRLLSWLNLLCGLLILLLTGYMTAIG